MNQIPLHSGVEADDWEARARYASRLGAEYFLRTLSLVTNAVGGNVLTAVILLAIMQANVAHVDGSEPADTLRRPGPPGDDERRPVSVSAVAAGLGVPYETVRRNVARLEKAGMCQRVQGGVIVPAQVLAGPDHNGILMTNWTNLRRLVQRVDRADMFREPRPGASAGATRQG